MGLTTLTEGEKRWQRVAKRAIESAESWESCDDCMHHHPEGFDGDCADPETRLPGRPDEFVG